MGTLTRLWAAAAQPKFMARLHAWLTVIWALGTIPMLAFGWHESVAFISVLSLYAIVTGHWSSWQATRVEVKQDVAAEEAAKAVG